MSNKDAAERFIRDLKINVNEVAESDAIALWRECETVAEPFHDLIGEAALSLLYRIQQGTYYKALDSLVEALSLTLLGSEKEQE